MTFLSSCVEHYQMPSDNQSMPCLNSFLSSCSPTILILISTVDPCILYFRNNILFALLIVNYVLRNVLRFFWQLFLSTVVVVVVVVMIIIIHHKSNCQLWNSNLRLLSSSRRYEAFNDLSYYTQLRKTSRKDTMYHVSVDKPASSLQTPCKIKPRTIHIMYSHVSNRW
jgi:hypothetical protein